MKVIFHLRIQNDIRAALRFYEGEGGEKLGDRFFSDVEAAAERVQVNPRGFHYCS